jgi:hypothetical protein
MAKKSRRARRRSADAAQPVRLARPSRPTAEAPPKKVDFAKEYHYVVEDLKRIAIIAAALFVLLVALAILIS